MLSRPWTTGVLNPRDDELPKARRRRRDEKRTMRFNIKEVKRIVNKHPLMGPGTTMNDLGSKLTAIAISAITKNHVTWHISQHS